MRMRNRLLAVSLFTLLFWAWESGSPEAARPSTPAYLVANAGQFDPAVRFQGRIGNGAVWLTGDAVWLLVPEPGEQPARWAALRLDFGGPLDWQPLSDTGVRFNLYAGSDPAAWLAGLPLWSAARARLENGAWIEIRGDGLALSADLSPADVRLDGAPRVPGEPLTVRLPWGDQPLPLFWPERDHRDQTRRAGGTAAGPTGAQLIWSTHIGGIFADEGEAVAIGPGGGVYISGQTQSPFFPTTPGIATPSHAVESFVARLDPTGSQLEYVTVFIGDVEDWGPELGFDPAGNAYLAGRTDSTDFPTTPGAYDRTPNGGFDAYLVRLDPAGQIGFSTLLGGADDEFTSGLVVDGTGAATLTGATFSAGSPPPAFPTSADAYEGVHNGGRDVFVARFSPDGSDLQYSTFVGGSGNEQGEAIAAAGGRVVVAGWTTSADFDTPAGGYDTVKSGSFDAFVFSLTPGSSSLDFWTYLGGTDGPSVTGERALALLLASDGGPVVAGSTVAADFPATSGAFDEQIGGGTCQGFPCSDGFVARLSADGSDLLWATFLGGEPGGSGLCDAANQDYGDCDDEVRAMAWAPLGEIAFAGWTASDNFPVSPDAFDGMLDGATDGMVGRLSPDGAVLEYATFLGGSDVNADGMGDDRLNGIWADPFGRLAVTGWSNALDFPTTPGSYDPDPNGDLDAVVVMLQPELLFTIFAPLIRR